MTKAKKEIIIEKLLMVKNSFKLTDEQFQKVFGISKEKGIENVIDYIISEVQE